MLVKYLLIKAVVISVIMIRRLTADDRLQEIIAGIPEEQFDDARFASGDGTCLVRETLYDKWITFENSIDTLMDWTNKLGTGLDHVSARMNISINDLTVAQENMRLRLKGCQSSVDRIMGQYENGTRKLGFKLLRQSTGPILDENPPMQHDTAEVMEDDSAEKMGNDNPEVIESDNPEVMEKGTAEVMHPLEGVIAEIERINATLINRNRYLESENGRLSLELEALNVKLAEMAIKAEKANNESKALETLNTKLKGNVNNIRPKILKEIRRSTRKTRSDITWFLFQQQVSDMVLKAGDEDKKEEKKGGDGIVYYRWGNASCQGNSQLLYSGFLAGQGRGAVNDLCLPEQPRFLDKTVGGRRAKIHGTQFIGGPGRFVQIPCAVCVSDEKAKVVMIPANDTCPSDWITEYDGFLSAAYGFLSILRGTSEFICLDKSVQEGAAANTDRAAKRLSYVGAKCGTLPCSIYPTDSILPCVVCSQ